jgi:hypothetical protein
MRPGLASPPPPGTEVVAQKQLEAKKQLAVKSAAVAKQQLQAKKQLTKASDLVSKQQMAAKKELLRRK